MNIYLVDFENVTSEGLSGVARLQEEDRVILFYSANAHKISLSVHRAICNTKAKVRYFEVAVGGKNALDHQLSTYLGYLIGQNPNMQYFIVSKDRGYEYLSDFWKNIHDVTGNINITRIDSIKIATPEVETVIEESKEELKEELKEEVKQESSIASSDVDAISYTENKSSKVVDINRVTPILKVETEKSEESKPQNKNLRANQLPTKTKPQLKEEINSIKTKSNNKITTRVSNNIVTKSSGSKNPIIDKKVSVDKKPSTYKSANHKVTNNAMQSDIFARDIRAILNNELEESQLQKVIDGFKNSHTKQELHIKLIGILGRKNAPIIYNKIKSLMTKVEKNATIETDIRGIVDSELKEEELKEVVECYRQSNSKQELHVKVIGALGREKGAEIYNKIKRLMSKIS